MANIADFACQWRSRWFCFAPNGYHLSRLCMLPPNQTSKLLRETKLSAYHTALLGVLLVGDIAYAWLLVLNAQSNENANAVPSNQLCVWPGMLVNGMLLCCWNQRMTKFDMVFFHVWVFVGCPLNASHTDHCWVMWMGIHLSFSAFATPATCVACHFCDVKLHRCPWQSPRDVAWWKVRCDMVSGATL